MENKYFFDQHEALEKCFELIKPSLLPKDDYEKLRLIRNRYKKGKLGQNGIETLLKHFGYEKTEMWYIPKELPQTD